jgi:hypothetical protein
MAVAVWMGWKSLIVSALAAGFDVSSLRSQELNVSVDNYVISIRWERCGSYDAAADGGDLVCWINTCSGATKSEARPTQARVLSLSLPLLPPFLLTINLTLAQLSIRTWLALRPSGKKY